MTGADGSPRQEAADEPAATGDGPDAGTGTGTGTGTETEAEGGATVEVDFDDGLVPAVAQDAETGEVLMLAYVSPEALRRTRETGEAHYHSRSRDELWHKGATSGHVQRVREVRVDCDADTLLYLVEQVGGACHTGHRSCFHRTVEGEDRGERVFDPDEVYE